MKKGGNEKMKNKFVLIRYILMLWMLCGACHTTSAVLYSSAQPMRSSIITHQPSQPNHSLQNNSWGYQQTYRNTPAAPARSEAYTSTFNSTSAFLSSGTAVTGGVCLGATSPGATLMESSWGDPNGDDPIGVIPNPTPVGEPTILFLFALLFLFVRIRSRFRIHFLSRSPSRF